MRTEWPIRKKGGVLNGDDYHTARGLNHIQLFREVCYFPPVFLYGSGNYPAQDLIAPLGGSFPFFITHKKHTLREPFSIPAETVR